MQQNENLVSMIKLSNEVKLGLGLGIAAIAILWWLTRKGQAAALGSSVGSAAGGLVASVPGGVVIGIGDGVGIPRTDMTECEKAKAEGRTWAASFVCPAGDFVGYLFGGK